MTTQHATNRHESVPPYDRILVSEKVAAQLCSVSLPTFRKWMQSGLIDRVARPYSPRSRERRVRSALRWGAERWQVVASGLKPQLSSR